jgi:cytochrome c5
MNICIKLLATGLLAAANGAVYATQHTAPERNTAPIERSEQPEKTATPPITGSHGELLYENHCTGCHTSRAHLRDHRRAKSTSDVEGWVRRWSGELKLDWSSEDVKDVTNHLVRRYYKFDSTPAH